MNRPTERRKLRLSQLCTRITSGGTPRRDDSANYFPATIPWVKTGDLRDALIIEYDERISERGVASSSAKILPPGTILMAMYGATVGRLGMLSEPAACNQAACAFIPDPAECDARWLFYALMNERPRLIGLANGAAQQNLSGSVLKNAQVLVPPVSVQEGVGRVLGALDDKIAANANAIDRADSLIAMHYENRATDAPASPLSGLASFINGRAFTKDATGTGRVVIRIAELNSGLGASTVRTDLEVVPEQHLAHPGDLLFAWSGSLTVHRWFRDEAIVNQHIFKVIPNGYPVWLVRAALDWALAEFKAIAADKTTTMGHIQRHHLDLPVPVPAPHVIQSLDPLLSALWQRALAAEQESLKLAELRDTLLGPLMSGRLKIKDAERVVEEVV